ncbi:MAG: DUF488 family protein [Elusimicrobia bacterium]|nr:DUF488 family protein [Elusimicrobiota bacterium]
MLTVKRVYESPSKEDGYRILVDRLWPRGISKERAQLYRWAKEISPSAELRREFGHEMEKFGWFKKAYEAELNKNPETKNFIEEVKTLLKKDNVTLVYGAKDEKINHAIALKDYVNKKLEKR